MFQLQSSVRHVSFFAGAKGDPGVNGVKGERGKVVCVCVCVHCLPVLLPLKQRVSLLLVSFRGFNNFLNSRLS